MDQPTDLVVIEREIAEGEAGKDGVVLETTLGDAGQRREISVIPDQGDESEILLEGRIEGLQVTEP